MLTARTHAAAALGAPLLALTISLTACGGDTSASPSSTSSTAANGDVVNAADVAFATDMIPHHAQALVMVDLSLGRPLDPRVEELMARVRDAQAPEIETMSDWLTAWDQPVPETVRDHAHADGAAEDSGDMPEMLAGTDLTDLEQARGEEFQTMLLELMVGHHEGAVQMARAEIADGAYAPARGLAEEIASAQEREMVQMQELLDDLAD